MANNLDLDVLGKNISDDFILNGTSMTEALIKTARDNGLNRHQINRVAEVANVESYLRLMKTASDKYIQFTVADPKSVADAVLTKSAEDMFINSSDYDRPPDTSISAETLFSAYEELHKTAKIWSNPITYNGETFQIQLTKEAMAIMAEQEPPVEKVRKLKEASLTKIADGSASVHYRGKTWNLKVNDKTLDILKSSELVDTKFRKLAQHNLIIESALTAASNESSLRKEAQVIEKEVIIARENLSELTATLPEDIKSLYLQIKQACLNGSHPMNVISVIKTASATVDELFSGTIVNNLKSDAPHLDYNTFTNPTINRNSSLFKSAQLIEEKLFSTSIKKQQVEESEKKYAEFVKQNRLPNMIGSTINISSPLIKEALDKISASPVLLAFAGGALLGVVKGKEIGERKQGRILQKATLKDQIPKSGVY